MGIYSSLGKKLQLKYNGIQSKVLAIKDIVEILDNEVRKTGFWSLDATKKLQRIKQLKNEVESLHSEVYDINQEVDEMTKDGIVQMDESDYFVFDTLNKESAQISQVISMISKKLDATKNYLTENNLWALFFDFVEEITTIIRNVSLKVFRIVKREAIKAAKEISKKLPPSTKKNIASFFSNISGFLTGRKDDDE
jgi:hypothetical protein